MQDVADAAGVSRATVSLVLSNAPGARIAATTRERVLAAASDLGYRRDLIASSLRRSRTDVIGLVSDRIATAPWGWAMVAGAREAAWARGRVLLMVNTGGEAAHEREAVENLLDRRVDGLVLGATYHRALPVPTLRSQVPVGLLDAYDPRVRTPRWCPTTSAGATMPRRCCSTPAIGRWPSSTARIPSRPPACDWPATQRRWPTTARW